MWVGSLGWEDPLEEGTATHSSILAWKIRWTEEPGGLQSTGSQRVRHDWATQYTLAQTSRKVAQIVQLTLIYTFYQIYQFYHTFKNHTCFVLSVSFFFSEPFESKLHILRSLTPTYFIWCLLPKPQDILLHHFSKRIKINIDTVSLWNW